MQIIYLPSSSNDLVWLMRYYNDVFSDGKIKALDKIKVIESLILANPYLGHKTHRESVREFSIPQTPFSFIYRVTDEFIEVLRLWDERRDRTNFDI